MNTTIIGLGWLGVPLAKFLKSQAYNVCGTSRTASKVDALNQAGYECLHFDLFAAPIAQQLPSKFFENSNIVINIAPGRHSIKPDEYIASMKGLINYAFEHKALHLTFVSTSSVFGNAVGIVDERSVTNPSSDSGLAHAAIEQYLLEHYIDRSAILRLAGLVGPNPEGAIPTIRHPVYALAKRQHIDGGNTPINLVHQFDVIQCIYAIIKQQTVAKVLHACSLEHPTRADYYTWAAHQLGMKAPKFDTKDDLRDGKIVSAEQTLRELGVSLRYPSPYDMLAD
jgi:nucleoside-diphosphate-sugar epimerase